MGGASLTTTPPDLVHQTWDLGSIYLIDNSISNHAKTPNGLLVYYLFSDIQRFDFLDYLFSMLDPPRCSSLWEGLLIATKNHGSALYQTLTAEMMEHNMDMPTAPDAVWVHEVLKEPNLDVVTPLAIFDMRESFKQASPIGRVPSQSAVPSTIPVPGKRQGRVLRNIRHTFCNVYRRLFSVVFVANMIAFVALLARIRKTSMLPLSNIATAASANILVAIMIRQDYIVNLLFRACWLVPLSAPLRLRRMLAKIYEYGGIHSGAAVAGTIWFVLLTAVLTTDFVRGVLRSVSALAIAYILLVLFVLIIIFAYPRFRFTWHDAFERTHRFAGWTAISLFWAEVLLFAHVMGAASHMSMGEIIIRQPTFWFLVIITFHIILPWLRLRQVEFVPEKLSGHALRLHFKMKLAPFSGLAISDAPLREWHPFATFPSVEGKGGSLIVSNAGDWTTRNIQNPLTRYWIKGVPRTGVLSMACIFRSCVVVTTGSGIGPCLSFLIDPSRQQPCRVFWSTPSPLKTYGQDICDMVLKADPNAVIIDTRTSGRPNMVQITYQLYIESGAEAVFVISNPKLTKKLVYAMESRGVPAFGPIWDS